MDDYFTGLPKHGQLATMAAPKAANGGAAWAPLHPAAASMPGIVAPMAPGAPHAHNHSHAHTSGTSRREAHVELVRRGGKIVQVLVTCPCGEQTAIDCVYDA